MLCFSFCKKNFKSHTRHHCVRVQPRSSIKHTSCGFYFFSRYCCLFGQEKRITKSTISAQYGKNVGYRLFTQTREKLSCLEVYRCLLAFVGKSFFLSIRSNNVTRLLLVFRRNFKPTLRVWKDNSAEKIKNDLIYINIEYYINIKLCAFTVGLN